MPDKSIRKAKEEDYLFIISVVNAWWGGRQMADMLPRLFFKYFCDTCFVVEDGKSIIGFLVGFISQSDETLAYVHFVGVEPERRQEGIAKAMYEGFFDVCRSKNVKVVSCVTSPKNERSIAFHKSMKFEVVAGNAQVNGISFWENYDGPGEDRVLFRRAVDVLDI